MRKNPQKILTVHDYIKVHRKRLDSGEIDLHEYGRILRGIRDQYIQENSEDKGGNSNSSGSGGHPKDDDSHGNAMEV